ncbi:PTS fructose transporter subunit IIB, partial [Listeria monocytogenes]|nr:PTS fructose transporter subunit IIB [Listeria monocytogenes]
SGKDRFKGKRVVEIPTDLAIKAPKQIINKIDKEINN